MVICRSCGTVFSQGELRADIDFIKKGARIFVAGALVSQTRDYLPIKVLQTGKLASGSKDVYKWKRMVLVSCRGGMSIL